MPCVEKNVPGPHPALVVTYLGSVTLLVQVIQRRGQLAGGNINFTRGWADYKAGFGALGGEFWAGNDAIR